MTKTGGTPTALAVTDLPRAEISSRMRRTLRLDDRREPKVAEIAEWIAIGIVEGDLAPGQDLNSVDLAKRFGTSRTPVARPSCCSSRRAWCPSKLAARRGSRSSRPRTSAISTWFAGSAGPHGPARRRARVRRGAARRRLVARTDASPRQGEECRCLLLGARRAAGAARRDRAEPRAQADPRLAGLADARAEAPQYQPAGRRQASLVDQNRLFEALNGRDADLAAAIIAGATRAAQRAIEDGFSTEPASA